MELFFTDYINDEFFVLRNDEFRHCTKVLRKTTGDTVNATDGKGNFITGVISKITKHEAEVKITTRDFFENNEKFNLAIAPTKNAERIEWLLEKAVETGIKSIHFINCEHSERKAVNIQRLHKIAISAMKQSNRFWIPEIYEPVSFKKFTELNKKGFIAHCYKGDKTFFNPQNTNDDCMILIGPEGDFSESEVLMAVESGFIPVSLGEARLRTETAAMFACGIFNFLRQIK